MSGPPKKSAGLVVPRSRLTGTHKSIRRNSCKSCCSGASIEQHPPQRSRRAVLIQLTQTNATRRQV